MAVRRLWSKSTRRRISSPASRTSRHSRAPVAKAALEAQPASLEALLATRLPSGQTVDETRRGLIARIGENIGVRRFELIRSDSLLGSYLHGTKIGTVVALEGGDETLARDLAMHVAAINPQFLSGDDVPAEQVAREREIFVAQTACRPEGAGQAPEIIGKMVEGKVRKYLAEITLHGQPFVRDDKVAVGDLLKARKASVKRFIRYEVGAGIEKKQENFADEVMAQVRGA
jgi:elongation factor Ts